MPRGGTGGDVSIGRQSRYRVNDDGSISELPGFNFSVSAEQRRWSNYRNDIANAKNQASSFDSQSNEYPFTTLAEATNAANKKQIESIAKLREQYESELSKERQYSALAGQIASLAGTAPLVAQQFPGGGPSPIAFNAAEANALAAQIASLAGPAQVQGGTAQALSAPLAAAQLTAPQQGTPMVAAPVTGASINQSLQNLSAENLLGSSGLAARLNFQVTDQQILDDYNRIKLGRLNNIVEQGNAQIAGITQRINTANQLLAGLPVSDPRRTASQTIIDQLKSDLASVTSAVSQASKQVTEFKPITAQEAAGAKEIASFREFLKLPEERALDQIFQIDPETMRTAVGLGERYRQMANAPIGPTTTPETEALRRQIEGEAVAQLQLGAQLGAEEQRQYQQAARAAQTARGNIFGVGPAVEEAVTTGAAGEQRKLARYGAAAQFLASGETTGAALQRDIAFRDALLQNRLGAAAGFIAGGPSLYNLSQARTGAQQAAFQNYIQANQALPGGFQGQGNQVPFYQTANPEIPVALSAQAASIYNAMQSAQASMYGSQVGAIASTYTSPFQAFGQVAGGIGSLLSPLKFG